MKLKVMIKKAIKSVFFSLVRSLNVFCIKKKQQVVFSQARSRYSANSKYLFEYLAQNGSEVYWLYTDDIQKSKIPSKYSDRLINRNSFKGVVCVIQSKFFVISHGSGDLGTLWHIAKNNVVLNLWHGICVKSIALVDNKANATGNKYKENETSYYSYMTVSSDIDRYVTSASHSVDVRNVLVTGNPRTDHYVRSRVKKTEKPEVKILYAPTFRDYELKEDLFFPFSDFSFANLEAFISTNSKVKIYLRPHPNDIKSNEQAKLLESKLPNNLIYYSQEVCDDIDEHMHMFDVTITDYSSIYLEPLLADIPCIFTPFDYGRYLETRGLAYNYDLVTPGPKASSFKEMLTCIEQAVDGAPEWAVQRDVVCSMFFKYKDDNACKRITEQVFNFTSNIDE